MKVQKGDDISVSKSCLSSKNIVKKPDVVFIPESVFVTTVRRKLRQIEEHHKAFLLNCGLPNMDFVKED